MDYMLLQDMESVIEITGSTMEELATALGVSRATVSGWLNGRHQVSGRHVRQFYDYAHRKGIRLNRIKEQLYREDAIAGQEVLLFHGAKTLIEGPLSLSHSKRINDFGNGFYCGESLEQSAMFVAGYHEASLYMLKFDPSDLKYREFLVDRDWMLAIAYYRGALEEYRSSQAINEILASLEDVDYVVAPIADNRMFELIDSFINGEITDLQCQHCLAATNLGRQYVFVSEQALSRISLLERCYMTELEKQAYLSNRQEGFKINMDKVKLARRQYRNQGEYIEDILK